MIDTGHYALQHIRVVADKLDKAWKEFMAGLDERTAVLSLSVLFHHKAEQVSTSTKRINVLFIGLKVRSAIRSSSQFPSTSM